MAKKKSNKAFIILAMIYGMTDIAALLYLLVLGDINPLRMLGM